MPLADNTKAWLKDLAAEGSLSDEQLKALEETFSSNEKVAKRLEESVLRQNDYDAKFNQRKQEHEIKMKDLADKEKATQQLQEELATWKTGADKQITEAKTQTEDEKRSHSEFTKTLKAKMLELGLDPAEFGITETPSPTVTPPKKPDEQTPTGDYLRKEDFQKIVPNFLMLPAVMQDVAVQHMDIFGKPLPNATELMQKAAEDKKSFKEVWESEYKVEARRKEIAEEAARKHDEEIRTEEREKVLSDLKLPTRSAEPSIVSPALGTFAPKPQQKEAMTGAEAAALNWKQGEYRQPQEEHA